MIWEINFCNGDIVQIDKSVLPTMRFVYSCMYIAL